MLNRYLCACSFYIWLIDVYISAISTSNVACAPFFPANISPNIARTKIVRMSKDAYKCFKLGNSAVKNTWQ